MGAEPLPHSWHYEVAGTSIPRLTRSNISPSAQQSSTLRLTTLGATRLEDLAVPESPRYVMGSGKPLALITYLAFAPRRTASREHLCDLLWGDRETADGLRQLRQNLWLCKSQIGGSIFDVRGTEIILATDISIDAIDFVRAIERGDAEEALALYGGDFVPHFSSPGSGGFEEWASLERTRYRSLFVNTAGAVLRQYLDCARHRNAIELARRITIADPHSEIGRRLLIESFLASGDAAQAIAEADRLTEWLRTEDREPEPATAAVIRLSRTPQRTARTEVHEDADPLVADLVGRQEQFSRLLEHWQESRSSTRCVRVSGPPGSGKTRLLADVLNRLRTNRARVIGARARFAMRGVAFSTVAEALEELVKLPGARAVSTGSADVMVTLSPPLSAVYPNARPIHGGITPLQAGRATGELIQCVAEEKPFVLAIDDLHWADTSSDEALALAVSRVSAPVLIILASRPGYESRSSTLAQDEVALPPLSRDECRQLLATLATLPAAEWPEQFVMATHQASGGSPLMLLATIRVLIDKGLLTRGDSGWGWRGAEAIIDAVHDAAADALQLPVDEGRQLLLGLIAVAGVPLSGQAIARSSSAPDEEVKIRLSELERLGLVIPVKGGWGIGHDTIIEHCIETFSLDSIRDFRSRLANVLLDSPDRRDRATALRLLAQNGDWNRIAAHLGARLSQPISGISRSRVQEYVGPGFNDADVTRILGHIPVLNRRRREVLSGGVLIGLATLLLATGRSHGSASEQLEVLVPIPNERGAFTVAHVPVDTAGWSSAPLFAARFETWNSFPRVVAYDPVHDRWASERASAESDELDIYLEDRQGTQRRLTAAPGQDRPGSFSPDGRFLTILTTRWSSHGWSSVAILDIATGNVRRLTRAEADEERPFWNTSGTTIAFSRDPHDGSAALLCTIMIDGTGERCHKLQRSFAPFGWLDDERVLVHEDKTDSVFSLHVVSAELHPWFVPGGFVVIRTAPPFVLEVSIRGSQRLAVARIENPRDYRIISGVPPSLAYHPQLRVPPSRRSFLDSLRIVPPGTLLLNVPHQLRVEGRTNHGRDLPIQALSWSVKSGDATVDSLGILTIHSVSRIRVEVTAGGWRTAELVVNPTTRVPATVMTEKWDKAWMQRWKPFGSPSPVVLDTLGSQFFNDNGDGTFFSGAYSRQSFDPRDGLALDFELRGRLTRSQWQVAIAGFWAVRDSFLGAWNHRTGYLADYLLEGCSFSFPQGEGAGAVDRSIWFQALRAVNPTAARRFLLGEPLRVRIQSFPDGRCGVAANGHALMVSNASVGNKPVHVVLEGNSVGSRFLVGPVSLQRGVPANIDWTTLHPEGANYFVARR